MEILTGWPKDVVSELYGYISDLSTNARIKEFYIGRTNNLDTRKSAHECDHILPVYETESVDHAVEVEDTLIKKFYNQNKCLNDNPHGGGGASDEYVNYVYVAVWIN